MKIESIDCTEDLTHLNLDIKELNLYELLILYVNYENKIENEDKHLNRVKRTHLHKQRDILNFLLECTNKDMININREIRQQ